ncbi:dihydrofolate reductase [Flavobacterium turcicum]|uniref:Dihydrofolate reductase n=1 Tax=Flavobacterium turcicum TaxID=2764718 RepID=A0ABR7JHW2_9FLAO|nr:dihydrofolate reductase [Flavobacterium turcicum]MBC5863739.1 dihydrofolate reductase [Flavobacterium turcicum]NHL02313.1 dihydrofolate reductase [Flavobacterium turcicum]
MIIMIAAVAENNALGKNNDLLWHLPHDFKRFKAITTGHHIIMGRKTFESFPKPLPNRTHVIITRQKDYKATDCIVVSSLEEALCVCPINEDVFIIGGGEIYNLALPIADKLDLTKVHHTFEADAYFPEIDPKQWKLKNSEHHSKDEKHQYDYSFESYERIE